MKRITLVTTLAMFAYAISAGAEVEIFSIDNGHSFANWEIRHVVAHISGTFHDIQGKVVLNTGNLAKSSVEARVSLYSMNSSNLRRDVHLLTEDFLDAHDYPEMKFISTSVSPVSSEDGLITGQLTLHGVTKPVTLEYQILGMGADPWGGIRAGFKAKTRIHRADFGISKFGGNGPVGNDVDITLLIEAIKLGADGLTVKKVVEGKPTVMSYPMPAASRPAPIAQPVVTPPIDAQPVMKPPLIVIPVAPPADLQAAPVK